MRTFGSRRNPEVSLVYVNFRSARFLRRSIQSVFSHDPEARQRTEIIIVNNDPEETWALLGIAKEFKAQLISLEENVGFSSAANVGSAFASGEIIGFLNPDTSLMYGSIGEISEFFSRYRNVGIVGAKLFSVSGAPEAWSAGKSITLWQVIRNNIGIPSGTRIWKSKKVLLSGFVSGGALFIRKNLFENLDGFDEQYFLYFEDVDLCLRARKCGFETVFFPRIGFCHEGGASHASLGTQKRFFYESQRAYFSVHRPIWECRLLDILHRAIL